MGVVKFGMKYMVVDLGGVLGWKFYMFLKYIIID